MRVFAKRIAELFAIDYPVTTKRSIACRLACRIFGASSASIFLYSGKRDKLVCKGRYIDPNFVEIGNADKKKSSLIPIIQNIDVYDHLYAFKNIIRETESEKLYEAFQDNSFRHSEISIEEFKQKVDGFDEWEKQYQEYQAGLRTEEFEINSDTLTGIFYRALVRGYNKNAIKICIENLEVVPKDKKRLCLTCLQKGFGLSLKAQYYLALPLFANNRYFGVLRFLFPQKMPFILSKNSSLCLDEEHMELFNYLAQIMSLHLENDYAIAGYKKTYLSFQKSDDKNKSLNDFLDEQCESMADIIEARGAMIRRWDSQSGRFQIMGYSNTLSKYIELASVPSPEPFFELISERFDVEPNILGIHYDCRDTPFKIKKYIHYEHIATQWEKTDLWKIPALLDHSLFIKLKDLGFFNIAILRIPDIPKCFLIFLNNENRKFSKEDIKMIYPAIRSLGLEWKAFDFERKKIEKRIRVVSKLHEETTILFKHKTRKAVQYARDFIKILSDTIDEFEIFTHHVLWQHITEIVPDPGLETEKYNLRNITPTNQNRPPLKDQGCMTGRRQICELGFTKVRFSQDILKYFNNKKLSKVFNFDLENDYEYFDLPFFAESEAVNENPVLVGIITLFYKTEDQSLIKHSDFFRFMRFLSKQIGMAWKNFQENVAFKIQEKIDNATSSDNKENHDVNKSSLNNITEILASELNCDFCCFMLADKSAQSLKLEGSNIPFRDDISHQLSDTNTLSVKSFNLNRNFRVRGNKRILEIANREKIGMIEAGIKEKAKEKINQRNGGPFYNLCIEHWLSVVITIGKEKLGLIKLFRLKGLKKNRSEDVSPDFPPPFSEFETNALGRIQKHIFSIILSHQAIHKRMEDMRNVLHQVISPLNALMAHGANIADGIIPEERIPEKLGYMRILSKTAAHYARNFQKILEIDTGKITLKKERLSDLKKYLIDFTKDFQPLLQRKRIQIHVTEQTKNNINLHVDKELFSHVISNLLDNAVKYSLDAEERTKIKLSYHPKSPAEKENVLIHAFENGSEVILEISNWGHALLEEERQRIYNREYRGKTAKDRAPVGTGIGLYIAQKIIQLHKGTIELSPTNHPNHFVFKITLSIGEEK